MNDENQQQSQQHTPVDQARDMAEQQIDKVIDEYAAKIPGGANLTGQAKKGVDGIMDRLEEEAEKRLGGLGGLFGGGNKNENQP